MKWSGGLCVALGLVAIVSLCALYWHLIIPFVAGESNAKLVGQYGFCLWGGGNILWNYLLSIRISPGKLKDFDKDQENEKYRLKMEIESEDDIEKDGRVYKAKTYCRKCRKHRPFKAHHCSVCQDCVLEMDHHCPWINNCVGLYNFRFFYKFLFWLTLSCGYGVWFLSFPVSNAKAYHQHIQARGWTEPQAKHAHQIAIAMIFILGGVLAGVGCLWIWNTYLVLTAQTTIEYYMRKSQEKSTSSKDWHQNWEQVFGRTKWKMASLLPSAQIRR